MLRNSQERGHQVSQMRLVYQNAHDVIIWFGESSDHIDSLFDWMNRLDNHILNIPRSLYTVSTWQSGWTWLVWRSIEACPTADIAQALQTLLRRDWFSRIWVIQEAAAAKSATITCGRNRVHSRTFALMPAVLEINCSEPEQARLDLMPGLLRDQRSWTSSSYSEDLGTLLRKFGHSNATDSRDIIYALIGLCEDAYTSDILRPNYEITLEQVIQNTVAYLLKRSGDLHKDSCTGVLPAWNLKEFLYALQDLPMHTFFWAMQHCEDKLLGDLLNCQLEKNNHVTVREYITYRGVHGPLVTVSIMKGNIDLLNKCLQIPEVDVHSKDQDGDTPLSAANKQRDAIFWHAMLEALEQDHDLKTEGTNYRRAAFPKKAEKRQVGTVYDEIKWTHDTEEHHDALRLGMWAVIILMLGSLWVAQCLGRFLWPIWWCRRVWRRWT